MSAHAPAKALPTGALSTTLLADQLLITITVVRDGPRVDFGVHPYVERQAVLSYSHGGRPASPYRPHRLRWFAIGLVDDETLEIAEKDEAFIFPVPDSKPIEYETQWVITPATGTVATPAAWQPYWKGEIEWAYSVKLKRGSHVVAEIDPVIIIDPDP